MKIKGLNEIDNTYLIIPDKEIEIYNISNLKSEVFSLVEIGVKNFILDLSKVEYIDSSGLGFIVSLLKKVKVIKGTLQIIKPSKEVMEILELTSLSKILIMANSLDEAVLRLK